MPYHFPFILILLFLAPILASESTVSSHKASFRDNKCGEDVFYDLDSNGVLTIHGTGAMWSFVRFNDIPWYGSRTFIRRVVIGDNITTIGNGAFGFCNKMETVTIGHDVTSIGIDAFKMCESLKDIVFPSGLRTIGEYAFRNCSSLKSVFFPDSMVSLGEGAFCFCESLSSVSIPNGLEIIESVAFRSCTSLVNVSISESVEIIGDDAFYDCSSLERIDVKEGNIYFSSVDGVLMNFDKTTIIQFPTGTTNSSYLIPSYVKSIGHYAFHGSKSLSEITIPDNVQFIDFGAFDSCTGLTKVTLPNNFTSIGDGVFFSCKSLRTIVLPDKLNSIGNSAFRFCTSLKSIPLPESITRIGNFAFYSCASLESIDIPDSVKTIGESAFFDCPSLKNVTIGSGLETIREDAFRNCNALESVIYKGSRLFSYSVFTGCSSLNAICVYPHYGSSTFCDKDVSFEPESKPTQDNKCFELACGGNGWIIEKKQDYQEWEKRSNKCYMNCCDNQTGLLTVKRKEAIDWESQSNQLFEYKCNNETGFESSKRKDTVDESSVESKNDTDLKPQNNHSFSSSSDATFPYVYLLAFVPVVAIVLIAIVLFATPLRGRIFGRCASKIDEEGLKDDKKGINIMLKGESVSLSFTKTIGKGAFGTVWLAEAADLHLAVKEIDRNFEGEGSEVENEVGIMSQLQSPYIVGIYDSVLTERSFFIVMEYVPLGSLSSAFEKYSFSAYMRCRFMLDVSRGMEYLHSEGIIHRDLKPGNVLVASFDPNAEVLCKITDFGESRKGLDQTKTMTMTCGVGTPYYMAPEMLRGDKKYSRSVDVYSFSIMCVELWNEKLPFSEAQFETPYAFIVYVMDGNRPQIRDDCPQALAGLLSRCWAPESGVRPPFSNVTDELLRLVQDFRKETTANVEHVKMRKGNTDEKASTQKPTTSSLKNTDDWGDIPLDSLTPKRV